MSRAFAYIMAWLTMSAIAVGPPALELVDYKVYVPALIALFAVAAHGDRHRSRGTEVTIHS